ncbi:MAG: leucine--tRNA ligase [Thermoleophilaceae bacterium]|nr:leucine--tRNA ligase [Thermoleophilaceae bacterium]
MADTSEIQHLKYDPSQIEPKWQQIWRDEKTWHVSNKPDGRPSSYVLEMLPYPSGEPHMGHMKVYSVGDALAHYRRRNGMRVLHPMGYDSFGLPAENFAIKTGRPPRESTEDAIAEFRRQFETWGVSIDWDREFGTHQPTYYRWTQWIFLKLFEAGLAYQKEAAVNWCPNDQTVLANEQVVDGHCERCGHAVEIKQLKQWFFKITDYADRLLNDMGSELEGWPQNVKTMQKNWIGRSEGAEVIFSCHSIDTSYPVFTTRPDTLFGATFFVMSPEHPDVTRIAEGTGQEEAVRDYVNASAQKTKEERGADDKEKTGVYLGRTITNPVNGEEIPMYVADYVLMEYGTGAIMAVPAHDQRDYEFAKKFEIEIRQVIAPASDEVEVPADAAYVSSTGSDVLINSGEFTGESSVEAKAKVTNWLKESGRGESTVNYKLRDWLISRQRYWGCPIPVVHCEKCGIVPVPEAALPIELPEISDYLPKGKSPLAAATDWVEVHCPECKGPAERETDTMDTFVDSSWYFMRYTDAKNDREPWHRAVLNEWMPVDNYIGGVEHAILHLMYARFFTKALHDLGLVGATEPFKNLFTQGMITRDGAKMSKSRGNVISPRSYVERYGADTARAYILFIGPPDQDADWADEGVEGVHRFLARLWRLGLEVDSAGAGSGVDAPATVAGDSANAVMRKANWAIDKVTADMEGRFAFNTAIAAVMELVNELYKQKDALVSEGGDSAQALRFATAAAASLLFPFAPHVSAEVYEVLGGGRVWETEWPKADESFLKSDEITLVVQVNGKVRDKISAAADATQDELLDLAKSSEKIAGYVDGKEMIKEIVVPGKLVNLVVKG